jgi:hypothetical protein
VSAGRIDDLEAGEIRDIATTGLIAWDDQSQSTVLTTRAKLATGIGISDEIGLIAERRIDLA